MVFHWSVPEEKRHTLNETYGVLYNEFRLGKMPPVYKAAEKAA